MDSSDNASQPPATAGALETLPDQAARDLRKLSHDLSNALEIIVQTSYLLSLAELKEPATEWLKMLDGGVTKALDINNDMRTYLREHSPR